MSQLLTFYVTAVVAMMIDFPPFAATFLCDNVLFYFEIFSIYHCDVFTSCTEVQRERETRAPGSIEQNSTVLVV